MTPFNSIVSAGNAHLRFIEVCVDEQSLSIGGFEAEDHRLSLTRDELDVLTSGNVSFISKYGNVTSYGLDHPYVNMPAVKDYTHIRARNNRTVHFANDRSSFRSLHVHSKGGIIIREHVYLDTYEGQILLWFHQQHLKSKFSFLFITFTNVSKTFFLIFEILLILKNTETDAYVCANNLHF